MTFSDSKIVVEIIVEKLTSYINYKQFHIKCQFADIFSLNLKDPNEFCTVLPRPCQKKNSKRKTVRMNKSPLNTITNPKVHSVLLPINIELLILRMRSFPMELSLWNNTNPEHKLGSSHIRWSQKYIDYLGKLNRKATMPPLTMVEEHNVFDEITLRRVATIQLFFKLHQLKDTVATQFPTISEDDIASFVYTKLKSQPTTLSSTTRETSGNIMDEDCMDDNEIDSSGIDFIKTINNGNHYKRHKKHKDILCKTFAEHPFAKEISNKKSDDKINVLESTYTVQEKSELITSLVNLVKSEISIDKVHQYAVIRSKSYTSVNFLTDLNPLHYIYGDQRGPFGNQTYCVGFFTVEKDASQSEKSKGQTSENSEELKARHKLQIHDSEGSNKKEIYGSTSTSCSQDLPDDLINITNCQQLECNRKSQRDSPSPPDERILLDLQNFGRPCCNTPNKVEEIMGTMETKLEFNGNPCFCSCECRFGFTKKTTYCNICGGYERVGDEITGKGIQMPFPCPIFHKLVDKNKLKTWSTSGSDIKKKGDDSQKSLKTGSKLSSTDRKGPEKSTESEKDKKRKKNKKDDRFKFNYGYEAPQIGHSRCAMPCTGTLGAVPKNMGWLWTAEDVPGIKFRPNWKPGATNKHVVRLLRMAKNPGVQISKKRRKDVKKKRPLKRPLLIIHKKDGEYTVTMETMKTYAKPRGLNQHPYEDKPVLTYTIGRTDEENHERKKKKERAQRRLERAQRKFIQSAFTDMCHEICLKTYQQALGILPDAESPECPCYPALPDADRTNLDVSCSCSEDKSSIGSDTDEDEWIVEFTPPNALFDPTFKSKKIVKVDSGSQYTYLDYKVKLLDKYGNPVPRYFKGPDGKQQCSDLGGFWSPDYKWLEINVDGFIAPDGRWAPATFIGPNGEQIEAEDGKFLAGNGVWLVIGIDGFINSEGKWRFYPKPKRMPSNQRPVLGKKDGSGDNKVNKALSSVKQSETTLSCFADISPKTLSKMGIMGHGQDKKIMLSTLKKLIARGEQVNIPEPSMVPRSPLSMKGRKTYLQGVDKNLYQHNCKHPAPSEKGIVAVNESGNKTYFRLKDYESKRPKERLVQLTEQGISLSSFHVPCFHSFVNGEFMKQRQRDRLTALYRHVQSKGVSTEA